MWMDRFAGRLVHQVKYLWQGIAILTGTILLPTFSPAQVETNAPTQPSPVPTTKMTWEECVQKARITNPDLLAARHAVENTDAARKGAYADFFPKITASYSGTRTYRDTLGGSGSSDTSSAETSTTAGLSSSSHYSNQYVAQLNVEQQIFNGFKTKAQVDQARAQWYLSLADWSAQKAATSFSLKSAFAQLIYSQELIRIAQSIVDLRQRNVRLINLLYQSGRENKGALLLSQANLTQSEYAYNQALRNRDVSERQLTDAMGSRVPLPIEAVGELLTQTLPPTPNFDDLALKTPTRYQQQARTDASAAGLSIAQADLYPTLSASGSITKQSSEPLPRPDAWAIGFTASLPIFEGGRTYFNVRAARAALQQNLEKLRGTIDEAALTLSQDFKSYVDAAEQVRVIEERLGAVKLRYQIAEAEYRNGLISFQDFDTITTDYVSQEQNYLATRRDAVIAEATWEQACGIGAIP